MPDKKSKINEKTAASAEPMSKTYSEPGIVVRLKSYAKMYQQPPKYIKGYYSRHPEQTPAVIDRNAEAEEGKIIMQRIPDPKDPSKPHPFLVKVATFKYIGKKRADMPESGGEIKILDEGYMYLNDVKVDENLEYFQKIDGPIFPNTVPRASNLRQAGWGDCFLLASILALLKQDGERFLENMMQQEGDYTIVRLYNPQTLEPCYLKVENSIFCQNGYVAINHEEFWMHILEKAYAGFGWKYENGTLVQSNGSVANIYGSGGQSSLALTILTGNKAEVREFSNPTPLPWSIEDAFIASQLVNNQSNENNSLLKHLESRPIYQALGSEALLQEWGRYINDLKIDSNNFECFKQLCEILSNWPTDKQMTQEEATNFIQQLQTLAKPIPEAIMKKFKEYVVGHLTTTHGNAFNFCGGLTALGLYTEEQLKIFAELTEKLAKNYSIVASAGREFDKQGVPGLRKQHAYAVIGVSTKVINGNDVKFVEIMNPWHNTGRIYDFANIHKYQVLGQKEFMEDPNMGTFKVELSDFVRYFSRYSACNPPTKWLQPEELIDNKAFSSLQPRLAVGERLQGAWQGFLAGISEAIDQLLPHTGKTKPTFFDKLLRVSVGIVIFPYSLAIAANVAVFCFKQPDFINQKSGLLHSDNSAHASYAAVLGELPNSSNVVSDKTRVMHKEVDQAPVPLHKSIKQVFGAQSNNSHEKVLGDIELKELSKAPHYSS